ncbi:hypothetical protein TRFO_19692 [Tritrichomonas foetus]|uniref:Uncharacterized protein n=1 Tax=Tritrichomonas foetus TaxID=1144522 RepID=A0A1J4KHM8_9EUKA|nr:hypothetical protein TRFO_19692 [Tritrichomonas foetus]|eukprot:OHT10895.1 hypothetical protein TRFO_19692 [Tritrichomonas foetus]
MNFENNFDESILDIHPKSLDQIFFLSQFEKASNSVSYALAHLLVTPNPSARAFYLKIINDHLRNIHKSINISLIDDLIDDFLCESSVLYDERFQNPEYLKLIYSIQANLTHILYPRFLKDIFIYDETSFSIYCEPENHVFGFFNEFNKSMNTTYCVPHRELFDYEESIFQDGSEENMISFFEKMIHQNDKRYIELWGNFTAWINIKYILHDFLFQEAILLAQKQYEIKPLLIIFTNLINRLRIPSRDQFVDIEKFHPRPLADHINQIFEFFAKYNILQVFFQYCQIKNDSETAFELFMFLGKNDQICLEFDDILNISEFMINIITIACNYQHFHPDPKKMLPRFKQKVDLITQNITNSLSSPTTEKIDVLIGSYLYLLMKLEVNISEFFHTINLHAFLEKANLVIRSLFYIASHLQYISIRYNLFEGLYYFHFIFTINDEAIMQTPVFTELVVTFLNIAYHILPDMETNFFFQIFNLLCLWFSEHIYSIDQKVLISFHHLIDHARIDLFISKLDIKECAVNLLKTMNPTLVACVIRMSEMKEALKPVIFEYVLEHQIDQTKFEIESYSESVFKILAIYDGPENPQIHQLFQQVFNNYSNFNEKNIPPYLAAAATNILKFESINIFGNYLSIANNDFDFILAISKIPTKDLYLGNCQTFITYGQLIYNFLKATQYEPANSQLHQEYIEVLTNAIPYFFYQVHLLSKEYIESLNELIVHSIQNFELNSQTLNIFFSIIIQIKGENDYIKWKILEQTKDVLLNKIENHVRSIYFQSKAKEIIKFHQKMYQIDKSQFESLLSQISQVHLYDEYMETIQNSKENEIDKLIESIKALNSCQYSDHIMGGYRSRL